MTLTDTELDALLARRMVEPPSADFATRILARAHATHQAPKASLLDTLRASLEFLIPHPKAAFASVLVLGLVMGLRVQDVDLFPSPSTTQLHIDFDEKGGML